MTGRIAVVKAGTTLPALVARQGDFEDWILRGLGLDDSRAAVADRPRGDRLPSFSDMAGVLVTGSHASVTDRQDWSEQTGEWLAGVVEAGIPVLGIFYGHQLLAHVLGVRWETTPAGSSSERLRSILPQRPGRTFFSVTCPRHSAPT